MLRAIQIHLNFPLKKFNIKCITLNKYKQFMLMSERNALDACI